MVMSNMITLITLIVMSSCFHQANSACCSPVEDGEFKCSTADFILIDGQKITKNSTDVRIKLPGIQFKADYLCGSAKDTITWATDGGANQLRFNYVVDGTVHWAAYCCDELTGPTEADEKCAVQEISSTCPKSNVDNTTCVYELITKAGSSQMTTSVNSVTGEAAAEVMAKAVGFSVKRVDHSESAVSDGQMVTTSKGNFLVIPAGFSFCGYTEGISVKDVNAPSGFTWSCSLTKFVQTPLKLGNPSTCVDLPRCDDAICSLQDNTCTSTFTCAAGRFPVWAIIVIVLGGIIVVAGIVCISCWALS